MNSSASGSCAAMISIFDGVDIGDNQRCFAMKRRRSHEPTIFADE
jgi:hypothetical protein